MKRLLIGAFALTAMIAAAHAQTPTEVYGQAARSFSLATGSPGELGLLKVLGERYAVKSGAAMHWYKAGTGASMKLLKEKRVDMIMVHAPTEEKLAVVEGWATEPVLIGSNEFYIVGPAADSAGVAQAKQATEVYRKVAAARAKWVSRGDNSGTHQKEMDLWKAAGVNPQGEWYIVTKDFMTASLKRADQEGAYFMTDSSTWIAEKQNAPHLKILFRGDPMLVNTYHALLGAEGATANRDLAKGFSAFVASPEGQAIIRDYGRERYGEGLYNDAEYAKRYVR